jgi:hypothetical protein
MTGRARSSAATETVGPQPACLPYRFGRQGGMTAGETHQAIEAIFRIERARLIAGLARVASSLERDCFRLVLSSPLVVRPDLRSLPLVDSLKLASLLEARLARRGGIALPPGPAVGRKLIELPGYLFQVALPSSAYGARLHTTSTTSAPIAGVRLVHFISSPTRVKERFWSVPTQLGNVLASTWRVRT